MTNTEVRAAQTAAGRELVGRLAFGSMAAHTLRAAVRLGVVELIGDGPRTAAEVADAAKTAHQPTTRLLRALTALGLLTEHAPDTFSVTPAGALLAPGHPDSLASFVRMFTDPAIVRAWEHLDSSVRTGEVAFDSVFGRDFFSHLAEHPELSADFNVAMSQVVTDTAAVLPRAFDFSRFTSVTDVGGGSGTLLAALLERYPGLAGVVFDTPHGLAEAAQTLARHGLEERCSLVAGDFFHSVPQGSDVYLVKSILHDWTDAQAVTILRHCRQVLPPGGVVLIVEPVLPEVVGTEDGGVYLSDLNMMVNVGGRERTREDFEGLCRQAALHVTSVTPLADAAPYSLIEAVAA
ncbi:methyltransferase [Streptomyces virginiae]|uniref:Methyltransferase n=1 Tax=Streptomyces virginiae TaxID=1961 RepID=A0ABQ3NYT1_STRVG|nr:methyltransferase [Streptomyces virginiae]MBP2343534.1 SAM-dependent methyltransferase [Streptomyces virginiae]GGQ38002.1 methyltransferase [Streptomyces virginiae]GHI17919.1 methyltransferase [Streptomyces virginiae]